MNKSADCPLVKQLLSKSLKYVRKNCCKFLWNPRSRSSRVLVLRKVIFGIKYVWILCWYVLNTDWHNENMLEEKNYVSSFSSNLPISKQLLNCLNLINSQKLELAPQNINHKLWLKISHRKIEDYKSTKNKFLLKLIHLK